MADLTPIEARALREENHVDQEIYVSMETAVRPTPLAGETVRLEVKQRAALPLFALFNPDGAKLKAQLLKLDDEDGVTYHVVAEGLHEDLVGVMDYLHEGEEALHGPR